MNSEDFNNNFIAMKRDLFDFFNKLQYSIDYLTTNELEADMLITKINNTISELQYYKDKIFNKVNKK